MQGLELKVVCLPIKHSPVGYFALRLVAKAALCSYADPNDLNLLTQREVKSAFLLEVTSMRLESKEQFNLSYLIVRFMAAYSFVRNMPPKVPTFPSSICLFSCAHHD